METTFGKRLINFRRNLHQYPEVSGEEFETQKKVLAFLKDLGCQDAREIARTGVMASFTFDEPGPTILIRGDMDALPIQEEGNHKYQSKNVGVGHLCGHDGHTAILCGLAKSLLDDPPKKGTVVLVFQPAEENGEGAKAILGDENFDIKPDFVFALHNIPGYPLHQLIYRSGHFTPAVTSIIIKLVGKSAHAAEPEKGINPAMAIAEIIRMFEEESNPEINAQDFRLATPIYINMGKLAYGTSAAEGEVHYTLRAWDNEVMKAFTRKIVRQVEFISKNHDLTCIIDWTQEFSANQNHVEAVDLIVESGKTAGLSLYEREVPFKWGEDFGLYTKKYNGAMFGLGAGENHPALHNPDYDFPDELLGTGIQLFRTIVNKVLR